MPEPVRQLIELAEARPFASITCVIAAILYFRLMMSGPRVY